MTGPQESYRLWCVVECDLETSRKRRPCAVLGRKRKTYIYIYIYVCVCVCVCVCSVCGVWCVCV